LKDIYLEKQTAVAQKRSQEKLIGLRKMAGSYITKLFVQPLARTKITPNAVSWFGFLLTLGTAWLILAGQYFIGGFAVIISGLFDMLDGALARSTHQVTKFGGILDSTLDRVSEAVLLLSLLPLYASQQSNLGLFFVGLAMVGSYMVSYIRARAEGAGIKCEVGILTRPERVVIFALGLILSRINIIFITIALGIIIVFSFISAGQRLYHCLRESEK
jgi:CDP-diacylglycerol---glycerol-3-phosphate 3-phosphatidyltransferase